MIKITLKEAAEITNGTLANKDAIFSGINLDTRTLAKNNLFIAFKGAKVDSHDLVAEARQKGAAACLVNKKINDPLPQLCVTDTIEAISKLAKFWRNKFQLPLVAVTGSNGKTTVKNMLAAIFTVATSSEAVLATEGNKNNNIGLPLTLCRLNQKHKLAVIEMGMNHFNEIDTLTRIAQPNIAVITNAASSHLAGVGDLTGVAKAKGEIFAGLNKNGTAILNADDGYYTYWKNLARKHKQISFGLDLPADVSAKYIERNNIEINTPIGSVKIKLPLLGRHNLMNAIAATAAAIAAEIPLTAIKKGLEQVKPADRRMIHHQLDKDIILIDDSYNANPLSLQAAVSVLTSMQAQGEKILVLGDMKELEPNEIELHEQAGKLIKSSSIDKLLTYGELTKHTASIASEKAMHFTSQAELLFTLRKQIKPGAIILVKGSNSMRMDMIVNILLDEFAEVTHL